jgi:uncharacterized protein YcfL
VSQTKSRTRHWINIKFHLFFYTKGGRKQMKKGLVFAVILALFVALAGCGGKSEILYCNLYKLCIIVF